MARERLLSMDKYSHAWGRAIKARDSILDSVTAEVTGKPPKMRRAGKLEAEHDYEQFQAAATPRLVAEMGGDLDFCLGELHSHRYKEAREWPGGLKFVLFVLFGLACAIGGGYWQQWWTS